MRKCKIWIAAAAALVGAIALSIMGPYESTLDRILQDASGPDWEQIPQRNIVKNSIPVDLLESGSDGCTVAAERFDRIIDHQYFVKAPQLAQELRYDREQSTLTIPCEHIRGEKSILHVWYVIPEAPRHAEKYTYFISGLVTDDR